MLDDTYKQSRGVRSNMGVEKQWQLIWTHSNHHDMALKIYLEGKAQLKSINS